MESVRKLMTALPVKSALGCNMTDQEREQWKADQYNSREGDLNQYDGYDCPKCKNKGWIAEVKFAYGYYSEVHRPCSCQKTRQTIRRLNRSGLQNIVKDYTFAKYEATEQWQKAVKSAAMNFCKDKENNTFFIGGQSGAGKTHICTAIAVDYIKQGKEVRYMLWRDEIDRIKAVVNDSEKYDALMKELKETDVLYIDDLFKDGSEDGKYKMPSPADVKRAFEIINYRYINPELVTIISSERTLFELNEIDEAIAGRIAERAKAAGYCLNIRKDVSRNYRMKGMGEI